MPDSLSFYFERLEEIEVFSDALYIRYIKELNFKKLLAEDPVFHTKFQKSRFLDFKILVLKQGRIFPPKKGRRRVDMVLYFYCCQNSKAERQSSTADGSSPDKQRPSHAAHQSRRYGGRRFDYISRRQYHRRHRSHPGQ